MKMKRIWDLNFVSFLLCMSEAFILKDFWMHGGSIVLPCETPESQRRTISWNSMDHYDAQETNSKFRFSHSYKFYSCTVEPRMDQPEWKLAVRNATLRLKQYALSDNDSLFCAAVGSGIRPVLKWEGNNGIKANGTIVEYHKEGSRDLRVTISKLKLNFSELPVTEYKCILDEAETCSSKNSRENVLKRSQHDETDNEIPGPRFRGKSPFQSRGIFAFLQPLSRPGKCVQYHIVRSACPRLTRTDVFLSDAFKIDTLEDVLRGVLKAMKGQVNDKCFNAATKLMCKHFYPDCESSLAGLPLCSEDCHVFNGALCNHKERAFMDGLLKDAGKKFRNATHFVDFTLPQCDALPSEKNGQECSHVHVEQPLQQGSFTFNCYKVYDRHYRGYVNVTAEGQSCNKWEYTCPYDLDRASELLLDLAGAENYCRNPLGAAEKPWCYSGKSWSYCNIPDCKDIEEIIAAMVEDAKELSNEGLWSMVVPFVAIIIVFSVVVYSIFWFYVKRRPQSKLSTSSFAGLKKEKKDSVLSTFARCHSSPGRLSDVQLASADFNLAVNALYYCPNYLLTSASEASISHPLKNLEYPRNELEYVDDLGVGCFGAIFHAKTISNTGKPSIDVAVKVLKKNSTICDQYAFESEALISAEMQHENIVKLIGVCFNGIGAPKCLIFEFMRYGDLKHYLHACSPDKELNVSLKNIKYDRRFLSLDDLLVIALQVVSAMSFFSAKGFVHRDLATRNCLVGENLIVKISDFGLSQRLNEQRLYLLNKHEDYKPIRWMSPEAITNGVYSVKSDVWSFGILLWELFSFGLHPYYGKDHQEVIRAVVQRQVLEIPEQTPQSVYLLMKRCWSYLPEDRPTFADLEFLLKQFRSYWH